MKIHTIINLIRSLLKKITADYLPAFAAQSALFLIISFFPFIMFLLTLFQFFPISESTLLQGLTDICPSTFDSLIVSIITEIYDKASGTVISITVISALWSASRGVLAIVRGLNSVYGLSETRNYFVLRFLSTFYTLVFSFMIILALIFLVFGNKIYFWITVRFPVLNHLALVIISFRTILVLIILSIFFLLIYIVIPNQHSKIVSQLPGALLSAVGWMLFSYLFSFYIDNFGNYSYMYGSLTAIVLLMLWVYFCMYIMFIGAEVNVFFSTCNYFRKLKNNS